MSGIVTARAGIENPAVAPPPAPTSWTFSVTSTFTSQAANLNGNAGTQTPTNGSGGLHDSDYASAHACWASNSGTNEAITADFGANRTLTNVKLGPANSAAPGGWGAAYTNGCELEYSTDGSSWTSITTVSGITASTTQTIGAGVVARYVRLRRASGYCACGEFWFT